ncbi:NB-ARC domain-containing protein [Leptothoe sp. EHU-05/26/07-4]
MARYALVVGISDYKSNYLKNLSKPIGDAEAIAQLLRDHGQCERVTVLSGHVTAEELEDALTKLIQQDAARNEAFIYFTGHGLAVKGGLGGTKGYLATSDCTVTIENNQPKRQTKAISFSDLNDLICDSDLSSLVMFIDACHSGELIESELVEHSFAGLNSEQDYYLITSCRGHESAWAKKREDHSVFTGAVLDVLMPEKVNNKGYISGDTVFAHLDEVLKNNRQEPRRFGKGRALPIVWFQGGQQNGEESYGSVADTEKKTRRNWGIPLQMPPLPEHFVERPEHQDKVKEQLLCDDKKTFGTLVVSAIYGLGGIGKSVLASKLAHDDEVQARFADGILWSTLGQNPDILPLLSGWIQTLGDHDYKPTAVEAASNHLRTLLYDKKVLLVVDDVWDPTRLEAFRVGGYGCCVLVTTREAQIPEAHRYSLDVMTPEQALELMTQKFKAELNVKDRQQALDFAERVGYLPLALELAASQVENGETWSNLLANFRSEVVRLEALDALSLTDMPDEAKRRHCSLTACFNLSLQRLSSEQLSQFAWLGVLPEDALLTQDMAMTLWQVTLQQAQDQLREFHEKAFLLIGSAQSSNNAERVTYRMHDLMHDLSRQLLTSPRQPEKPETLSGLGLTLQTAHQQLLRNYQFQTQKDQWYTLPNDGYIHSYLTWHMEQAGKIQAIHALLKASNESGRNGWHEVCDKLGQPALFLNDLGRAWRLAVENYNSAPGETLALLWRYAMIRASLHSMASNVPTALLVALIKHGWWSAAQGLAYIQQVPEPKRCSEYIVAIVPYLSESLLPEARTVIAKIQDSPYQVYTLAKLAEHFPSVWPDVLNAIPAIQDHQTIIPRPHDQSFFCRAIALAKIITLLPENCLPQATILAYQIRGNAGQALALTALAIRNPELQSEALEKIQTIENFTEKAYVLNRLSRVRPGLVPQALAVIRQIQRDHEQMAALEDIRPILPKELWSDALDIITAVNSENRKQFALQALIQDLPTELYTRAFDIIQQIQGDCFRSHLLAQLTEDCPSALLPDILAATERFQEDLDRSRVLLGLSQRMPDILATALAVARKIEEDEHRITTLANLSQRFPEVLPETIQAARQIEDKKTRALMLAALSAQSSDLVDEVLSLVHQIPDAMARVIPLRHLVKYHPESLPEILSLFPSTDTFARTEFLTTAVSSWLPPSSILQISSDLLVEALEGMCQSSELYYRIKDINQAVQRLPAESLPQALLLVQQIRDKEVMVRAFRELTKQMPQLLTETLKVIKQLQSKHTQSCELRELSRQFPELLSDALAVVREIQDATDRAWALSDLSQLYPSLLPETLIASREIPDKDELIKLLIALSNQAPVVLSDALALIHELPDEQDRTSYTQSLAEHISQELLPDVLAIAHSIQNPSGRSSILCTLANRFPELCAEALSVVRNISDELQQAQNLRQLSEKLSPALLPEVLELTRGFHKSSHQADVLAALCERFPELLSETLATVHNIQTDFHRISLLCKLAIQQPSLFPTVLTNIREVNNEALQTIALCTLFRCLPCELMPDVVSFIREIQDESRRALAISNLVRYLPSDLSEDVLTMIRNNIQSEAARASALRSVGKSLPESWLSEVLEMLWQIRDPYYRSKALKGLLPHLAQDSISFTDTVNMLDTLAYQKRESLLDLLPDIRPIVLHLADERAFSDVLQAVRDVCAQWP